VQGLQNVEVGNIISIRAGSTRRQGPTPLDKPFRFPNLPLNVGSLKVDILRPLGSCRVSVAPEAEEEYSVLFPPADGVAEPMRMDLLVRELPQMCGVLHTEPDCPHQHQSGIMQQMDRETLPDDPERRANAEESARAYMERWRLMDFIREMLQYIIREKPQDPYAFMSTYLRRRTRKERDAANKTDTSEGDTSQDTLRETIARQNARLDAENERLRSEIEQLRTFCEEKGLPPVDEPLDLSINTTVLGVGVHEELSGRNSQLRVEHQELRRTLDSFTRGFQELAGRLNAVVAAAPYLTVRTRAQMMVTRTLPYEDVHDAELETERANARIERENAALSQQIAEFMASDVGQQQRQSV